MRRQTEFEATTLSCSRAWILVVGALLLFALTLDARAQTGDTADPTEPAAPTTAVESDPEAGAEDSRCPCCQRRGGGRGYGQGCHGGKGRGQAGMGRGPGHGGQGSGAGRPEARVIHFLIDHHEELERTVAEIPGGVRTRTVSENPEIVDAVRTHVRQMVDLIHNGGRIRNWDPLFREIFDHREAIEMEITDIEGGVQVTETSEDAQVTELIRAHAVKVEEFVARGIEAYREETPLPEGYSSTSP